MIVSYIMNNRECLSEASDEKIFQTQPLLGLLASPARGAGLVRFDTRYPVIPCKAEAAATLRPADADGEPLHIDAPRIQNRWLKLVHRVTRKAGVAEAPSGESAVPR